MNNYQINQELILGNLDAPGVLPHLDALKLTPFIFEADFGLAQLPTMPWVIMIRGPRQYGKSTWLEQQIALTITNFGKGSALYLNGDEIADSKSLMVEIKNLASLFSTQSKIKRLFVDEITAIPDWHRALKRLLDAGELKDILLITTGSKATDLRRGIERLPGRRGQLPRSDFIFTPISYREFKNKCGDIFDPDPVFAYLLTGGSPIAINALAQTGRIPEYITATVNDWVMGEFAATGRSRAHLMAVLQSLYRMAGTPIGQAKLARESGLSNNTIAQGYIELLADLLVVTPGFPYDAHKKISLFRKACKYHFVNLLVALTWHPQKPRTVADIKKLGQDRGPVIEWLVAQEIWRRLCITQPETLSDHLPFWQTKEHEIDFILPDKRYVEVKAGQASPLEFTWFLKNFPRTHLTVVNQNRFDTEWIKGITIEDFLMES